MRENNAKVVKHEETEEEAIKNIKKVLEAAEKAPVETEEAPQAATEATPVETKEEAVNRVAEPLSVTIEKARKDINTAVIMAERNYGLHSSITVLILESVLANVRAGNATVAAMEFEQYKGELLKNE